MKFPLISVFAVCIGAAMGAQAAGGAPDPFQLEQERKRNQDPLVEGIQAAVAKADWPRAQELAREGVAKNPASPEYHNLYAYSMRKGPNPDMDMVFKQYEEALRIDPKHLGAHEYIGEAYLQMGNLAKAKEHLTVLDKICFFGCEEYSDLKKAVALYEKDHKTEVSLQR